MAFSPVVAVLDACTLYPFHLSSFRWQSTAWVHARWTDEIHDEWMRNLVANAPDLSVERLAATKQLMRIAWRDAIVGGYAKHIDTISLPGPGDRHVVAAAIEAKATHILTWNLRHFPARILKAHGLARRTPDAFLADPYDQVPQLLLASLANARRNLSKSGLSAEEFLNVLRAQKLTRLAKRLRGHLGDM
ncbi:MAG: PIN domain-containing protein [Hyphomonadaceae bacterium]|nr:PIN domain-containing protein [Hyphomonadaceae bacterium]